MTENLTLEAGGGGDDDDDDDDDDNQIWFFGNKCFSNRVRNLALMQHQRCNQGGGQPPQTPQKRNLKNTNYVDIMISEVLCDFPVR
jgi:hypothetical protein